MLRRRSIKLAATAAFVPAAPDILRAEDTTGVTDTEIRIGNTTPYSGPASAYGTVGKAEAATFKMANDAGGFAGRKVNFISYDDGYSPPKTLEQVRRLIEEDKVACLFCTVGTACNTAIVKYVNQKKVPHLFVGSAADKWGDYKEHPWTIGLGPSYATEAQVYAKYILALKPEGKIGILYQNDDFGRDYLKGIRDVLSERWAKMITTASYEVTDATVDSQLASLQGAGVNVLVTVAGPKFAAQTIRKVSDMNWKPMHILSNVSASVGAVILPAGPEKAVGIVSSTSGKDPTDPFWDNDAGVKGWREFMAKYYPEGDLKDGGNFFGYGVTLTMIQVLKQCGNDLSRENMMRQATNLKDFECPTLLPGIKVNTSPTNYRPVRQLQLMRWNGKIWERFGDLIDGETA